MKTAELSATVAISDAGSLHMELKKLSLLHGITKIKSGIQIE
jgi:hypothetical protein